MKFFAVAFGLVLLAAEVRGQSPGRDDPRIDVARLLRPDRGLITDWRRHAEADLERLDRTLRQIQTELNEQSDRRLRDRFRAALRATARLHEAFDRREITAWEVRRRAEEIRGRLEEMQRELHSHKR